MMDDSSVYRFPVGMSQKLQRKTIFLMVVSPEGVRCVISVAEHNSLDVFVGDVYNTYLNGTTWEELYIILGPEYGL